MTIFAVISGVVLLVAVFGYLDYRFVHLPNAIGMTSSIAMVFVSAGHHGLGGLRGGIFIALALSLPKFPGREMVVSATYVVVIFSILVQAPP